MDQRLSTASNGTSFNKTSSNSEAFPFHHWAFVWISCIAFLSILGNSVIIHVLWRNRSGFSSNPYKFNYWLISLATADLTLSLIALPNYVVSTSLFPHPSGWQGEVMCKLFTGYALWNCLLQVSIYHIAGISTERLKLVLRSNQARDFKLATKIKITVAWILPFLFYLPVYVTDITYSRNQPVLGNYCTSAGLISSTVYLLLASLEFILSYLMPLLILVYCSFRIGRQVKYYEKAMIDHMVVTDSYEREQLKSRTRKTLVTLVIVTVAFVACWSPTWFMHFILSLDNSYHFNSESYQAAKLMGFSNSFINCLVYASLSNEFRKYFCRTFPTVTWLLKSSGSLFKRKKKVERTLLIRSNGRRKSPSSYGDVTMASTSTLEEDLYHGNNAFDTLRVLQIEQI